MMPKKSYDRVKIENIPKQFLENTLYLSIMHA